MGLNFSLFSLDIAKSLTNIGICVLGCSATSSPFKKRRIEEPLVKILEMARGCVLWKLGKTLFWRKRRKRRINEKDSVLRYKTSAFDDEGTRKDERSEDGIARQQSSATCSESRLKLKTNCVCFSLCRRFLRILRKKLSQIFFGF